MKRILNFILHTAFIVTGRRSVKPVALANQLGGIFDHGRETLQIDPSTAFPVPSKYLVYKRGSSQYYAAVADGVSMPLGISPDAPYQLGDFVDVERFGATFGTVLGYSAGAVTIDDLVYSAANGLVGDLISAGHGTFWIVGRAVNAVSAANQEITFVPCFPYQVTQ